MNKRDNLVAALLAVGLVAFLVPMARLGVNFHHDGIMLKPALDVLSGQVLFRDTFTQYGALTTYLQAAALWIRPGLLSLKLLTVAAYGITLFFLYLSWRLILPRSLALLSCGLFVLFIPAYEKDWLNQYWHLLIWSSVLAMMFEAVSLYALFKVIRGEQAVRWGLVLGLSCACIFWCRQPVGLIIAGCVAATWLALQWAGWAPAGLSKSRTLGAIVGGFVAVHALFLGDILLSGAGSAWWYQNIVWPGKWSGTVPLGWGKLFTVYTHLDAAAWLLAFLLAAALPRLLRRFRPELPRTAVLAYYLGLGLVLVWRHAAVLPLLALRDGGWTALFPLIILGQAAVSLGRAGFSRNTPKTTEYYLIAALAAVSLGSLLQYYPLPDSWHMLWSLAPAFGLGVFVFWRWLGWSAPVMSAVFTLALLPGVATKARLVADCLTQPWVTLNSPAVLRGMKVLPAQARSIGQIADTMDLILRKSPDLPSILIGNDALVLTFTHNHFNPLPYYVNWPGLADDAASQQRRWGYIEEVRPMVFFQRARWDTVNDFYRRAHYVPLLYATDEAMEIAVPQELATAMGLAAYGAPLSAAPKP